MEKQRPPVVIESAEPLSSSSSQSESEDEPTLIQKRPTRMNAISYTTSNGTYIPRGMRPANSGGYREEKEEEEEEEEPRQEGLDFRSLKHPLVLVAASIGLGLLISYYGVGILKPAVDKVVEAAEEIVEESNQ